MKLVKKERETRPKRSRGVDWSRDIIVLARYGTKELWWLRGVTLSYSSISKEYVNARLELVPDAQMEWEGRRHESKELFMGGRLSKRRFAEHAEAIDKFFGVPGLAAALDSRKTVVVEES